MKGLWAGNPPEEAPGGDQAANPERGNPAEVSRRRGGAGQGGGGHFPPIPGAR